MNLIILLIVFIWGWVEINAFIVIGSEVGVLLTILGVFVTAMIGVSLLKSQGRTGVADDVEQQECPCVRRELRSELERSEAR